MTKVNKNKVVTFQLVSRSVEDPNNADPNASEHVLVPIHIGKEVDQGLVEQLQKQMTPQPKAQKKQGIGSRYNKIFGSDLPDDGEDYSKYFKAIDEENDDGVFVAPDGSVHDLKTKQVEDVDLLVDKLGFTKDLFGTQQDPNMPKLVDDTLDPLACGIDPDVLLAMDDESAIPLEDDFIMKCLDAEMNDTEEEDGDGDGGDDDDSVDDFDFNGNKTKKAMSRVSVTPSHSSHVSHRSRAMDFQEEKVDYIVDHLFNDEEDEEEEEGDAEPIDWKEIAEDMKKFNGQIKLNPVPRPPEGTQYVPLEEEEMEEEEEEYHPQEKPLDIRSVADFVSTTDNLPSKIQDKSLKRKRNKKTEEEDKLEVPLPPEFMPKPNETKEEAKARKKAIKEYQRKKRAQKKERKMKFAVASKKVHKSIAASGGSRGQTVYNLD